MVGHMFSKLIALSLIYSIKKHTNNNNKEKAGERYRDERDIVMNNSNFREIPKRNQKAHKLRSLRSNHCDSDREQEEWEVVS